MKMKEQPNVGGLSAQEKLKNASRDLLAFAEAFCAWCVTPETYPPPRLIMMGYRAVEKAGGKLPRKDK